VEEQDEIKKLPAVESPGIALQNETSMGTVSRPDPDGGLASSDVCAKAKTTSKSLHVGTLNVENFYTNIEYIKQMLHRCDILCIQEHWLYNFQSADIQLELDDVCVAIKCVDDNDPIPPLQRPRGMGGVATIWKSSLDNKVTIIEDGGDRVQATLVETERKRICIINTYMPCRGKTHGDSNYNSVMYMSR
jgi:exonuclease III